MAVASFEDPEPDRVGSSTHSADQIHTLIALFDSKNCLVKAT